MAWPEPRYDRCLVTGASAGLGWEFALALAPRAKELVLVARRRERLEQLADRIAEEHGTPCRVVPCDLGAPGAGRDLITSLENDSVGEIDLLVNNAGFGRVGALEAYPAADFAQMVAVNVASLTDLTVGLWPALTAAPGRGVIHVASCAGFQPIPWFTVYAATKAYVRSFSNGLWVEGRERGTRVLSLCPGPERTEFGEVAGMRMKLAKPGVGPRRVIEVALRAYERGRMEVIPGTVNRLLAFSTRLLPVSVVARIAGRGLDALVR